MKNLMRIGKSMYKTASVTGLMGAEWWAYIKLINRFDKKGMNGAIVLASLAVIAGEAATVITLGSKTIDSILEIE